jgi:lysyl-tRNA synthetase class 2
MTVNCWHLRAELKKSCRHFFENLAYLEIETPVLVKCPGTEVYLRYFDTQWTSHGGDRKQLYLRSSPELHMKMAFSDGCPRVFQFAPSFRNGGEFSEWHHPEFTMLEWYQEGLSYHELISQTEDLLRSTASHFSQKYGFESSKLLPERIERWSVFEMFENFLGFKLIDNDKHLAKRCIEAKVLSVTAEDDFDTAFSKCLIERIEPELEKNKATILMDYPPSQSALSVIEGGRACRFELYVGRIELCNGFYELNGRAENQNRIGESFEKRRIAGLGDIPIDEEFLDSTARISRPYSGNALGFDRWLAILCGHRNLDIVVPFRNAKVWR